MTADAVAKYANLERVSRQLRAEAETTAEHWRKQEGLWRQKKIAALRGA